MTRGVFHHTALLLPPFPHLNRLCCHSNALFILLSFFLYFTFTLLYHLYIARHLYYLHFLSLHSPFLMHHSTITVNNLTPSVLLMGSLHQTPSASILI
ncbi:MAG: hypothetical protein J3R72DRAFT_450622 [Linnemannia gamsii]|nr:MAG: hypothetical protein J3R72DRAFT_450622 [Linnemannia gamsii]